MTVVGTAEVLIKAVDNGLAADVKRKVESAVDKADAKVVLKVDNKSVIDGSQASVAARVKEIESLTNLKAEYLSVAKTATQGSAEQIAASKLAAEATQKLATLGLKEAEQAVAKTTAVTTKGLDEITSRLTSGLGPASGEAKAALDGLTKSGSLVGPAIAGGVAIAGVALAAFAIDGAQKFVALAGEIRNFQRLSGASAEESSRLVAVLDDLGVSSQTGANAMFLLSKKVAAGGVDLKNLGVDIATTKEGTADLVTTLLNVADAYAAQPDPAKRAEIAFAAFGRQGKELVPLLEQGRAGLEKFFASAEGGRQIFSQADLDKARKYEIAVDDLSDTFRGFQLQAGEALLPFLSTLSQASAKTLSFLDSLKTKAPSAFDAIKTAAAGAVGGPIAQLFDGIGSLGGKGDGAKRSQKELADQVKLTAAAQQDEAAASKEQADALDKVTNATLSAISSQVGYEASLNSLRDNINDIDDRTKDYQDAVDKAAEANRLAEVAVRQYGVGSDQAKEATIQAAAAAKDAEQANRALRDAHLGVEQSALQTAGAVVKLAEDTANASGATLSAQEKSDIFRAALVSLADQASGPTKDAILRLADKIKTLPDRTVTVDVDTGAAQEKLDTLQRTINAVESSGGAVHVGGQQEFALGMEMGPVRGPAGKAVPVLAHAGEWVLTQSQLDGLRRSGTGIPSSSTVSTLSSATALTISGPLVVVQGGVAPGQEASIGAAVRQAVTQLVADGTVGRAMAKRSESLSRR